MSIRRGWRLGSGIIQFKPFGWVTRKTLPGPAFQRSSIHMLTSQNARSRCQKAYLLVFTILVLEAGVIQAMQVEGSIDISGEESSEVLQQEVSSNRSASVASTQKDAVTLGVTPAGVQRHIGGKWATMAVNGVNETESDAEETVLFTLEGDESNQVARRVWVPAGSRRQAWFPIRIPEINDPTKLQITGQSIQLAESANGETFQSNRVGSPTSKRSLLLSPPEDEQSGMMVDSLFGIEESDPSLDSLNNMLYLGFDSATNVQQDLGMVRFGAQFLPTTQNPLDSLDSLIIANDRLLSDTVGTSRLRQWVNDGGRLWLMADKVSAESIRRLLGDSVRIQPVESVELSEFTLEKLDPFFSKVSMQETWRSETPVDFVRVLIEGGQVDSQIDGWPAAVWLQTGKGEILVTTLGHQGWVWKDAPLETYKSMASRFFVERDVPADYSKLLVSELNREIGYQIPSRGLIVLLLGGHFACLGLIGVYLSKTRTLQRLGYILPLSVLVTVTILLVVGSMSTSAVPSTIAFGQIARALPESAQLQIDSSVAVYSQANGDLPISTGSDLRTELDEDWDAGEKRRQLFTDDGSSTWRFLKQPPGKIQHFHVSRRQDMRTPWVVNGTFTSDGFSGRLIGPELTTTSDAMIVSAASPSMTLVLDETENGLMGGADQVLLPNQYYQSTVLTELQRKRQQFIRGLMDGAVTSRPTEPALLLWTDPVLSDLSLPDDYVKKGWALVQCPLRIETPTKGQPFLIPSAFIHVQSHRGDRGISTLYDAETGTWIDEVDKPAEVDLRVQLPDGVGSAKINECEIAIHATAQGRTMRFYCFHGGEKTLVHELENPQGLNTFSIEDMALLELDSKSGFRLTLEVSETEQERAVSKGDPEQPTSDSVNLDTSSPAAPDINEKMTNDTAVTWSVKYLQVTTTGVVP